MKIIVDAFGGDFAPLAALKGCEMAVEEYGVEILLTGDEKIIKTVAQKENISLKNMEIVNTSLVMPVCADPAEIMKEYAESSIAVGLKLLSEGKGDAFVGAGSTGALVVGASLIVKRIRGIKRAALAPIIPTMTEDNGCYMLIDCGANNECRPEMLVQFGIMGSAYMSKIIGMTSPKVGLVNNGAEESKGKDVQIEAYSLLKKSPVNFIGNVEARGIPLHECDVAVCDGFTGNVILKLTEGLAKSFSGELKRVFKRNFISKLGAICVANGVVAFKKKMDYTEYGGAPLMGISKPVIKAHGSSNAKAFKNAIRQAKLFTEKGVISQIEKTLAQMKSTQE